METSEDLDVVSVFSVGEAGSCTWSSLQDVDKLGALKWPISSYFKMIFADSMIYMTIFNGF